MQTIVVGDVQGCLDELKELTKLVEYKKGTDRMILAGDLVDRGPDSLGVVRYAQEQGFECVMGNHDFKYVEHRRRDLDVKAGRIAQNPKKPLEGDRRAFYASLTDTDFEFLANMPLFIRIHSKWVVVHAGCESGIPIEEQTPSTLIYMRKIHRETGRMLSLSEGDRLFPDKAGFWTEFWRGPDSVVYGHSVHRTPTLEEPSPGVFCVGIDTGCCFGNTLTAAIFNGYGLEAFASVDAKREYYKPRLGTFDE